MSRSWKVNDFTHIRRKGFAKNLKTAADPGKTHLRNARSAVAFDADSTSHHIEQTAYVKMDVTFHLLTRLEL